MTIFKKTDGRLKHALAALSAAAFVATVPATKGMAQAALFSVASVSSTNSDTVAANNTSGLLLPYPGQSLAFLNFATVSSTNADPNPANNGSANGITSPNGFAANSLVVAKAAASSSYQIGDTITWTISARNQLNSTVSPFALRDKLPPTLQYVAGSSRMTSNGALISTADPVATGAERQVEWQNLSLAGQGSLEVSFKTRIGVGLDVGTYYNQAVAMGLGQTGTSQAISNVVNAPFRIAPTAIFDCAEIIGRVFKDDNRNGYPDQGETGLANMRLVAPRGIEIRTDKFGRYRVPCAAIPDNARGSNFVLKLDERVLPTGHHVTTENPRSVRLTRGKMTRMNFGVSIHREVRLDLTDDAFVCGANQLKDQWRNGMNVLLQQLGSEPSILKISYRTAATNGIARPRMQNLATQMKSLIKSVGADAEIRTEIKRFPSANGVGANGCGGFTNGQGGVLQGTQTGQSTTTTTTTTTQSGQQGFAQTGGRWVIEQQQGQGYWVQEQVPVLIEGQPRALRPGSVVPYIAGMVYVAPQRIPSSWIIPNGFRLVRSPNNAYFLQDTSTQVFYSLR